jgi:hypothetical protein
MAITSKRTSGGLLRQPTPPIRRHGRVVRPVGVEELPPDLDDLRVEFHAGDRDVAVDFGVETRHRARGRADEEEIGDWRLEIGRLGD